MSTLPFCGGVRLNNHRLINSTTLMFEEEEVPGEPGEAEAGAEADAPEGEEGEEAAA